MKKLILDSSLLPLTGLMTEELFFVEADKLAQSALPAREEIRSLPEVPVTPVSEAPNIQEATITAALAERPVQAAATPEQAAVPQPAKIPEAAAVPQPATVLQPVAITEAAEVPEPEPAVLTAPAALPVLLQEKRNARSFQTRGFYKKPLLFIAGTAGRGTSAEEYNLVENILKALNMSMDDIAFLDLKESIPLAEILTEYRPRLILSFGADILLPGWPAELLLNEPLKLEQVMYLKAVDLDLLNREKAEKGKLWTSLKILFKI